MKCAVIRLLTSTVVWALVLSSGPLVADENRLTFAETVAPELRVKAVEAVDRFVTSRLAWKQGQFKARGTVTHTYRRDPDKSYSGPVEVSSAFDFDRKLFRFDRSEYQRVRSWPNALPGESEADREARATSSERVRASKYALNEEKCIHWSDNAPREVRVAARDHKTRSRSMSAEAFDVREIGFPASRDFGPHWSLESRLTEYFRQPIALVEEFDSGRIKLECRFESATRTLWLDPSQGNCPVYMGLAMKDEREESVVEASTNWQQIKGLWVPSDTRWTSFYHGSRDGAVQTEYVLKFEWERINEAPAPERFRVESFMTDDGMRIAEIRF